MRWIAGATFTLYLLHVPVAQFLAAVAPWPATHWGTRALVILGTLGAIFALAEVTERRKTTWRRMAEAVLRRAVKLRPAPG